VIARTLRALTSRTLARRFAWILDERVRRRRNAYAQALDGLVPGFPDEAVQAHLTGNAGELMLWQAFNAYHLIRASPPSTAGPSVGARPSSTSTAAGAALSGSTRTLAASRLWGVDVNP